MNVHGKNIKIRQVVCLVLYYGIARYLPESSKCFHVGGKFRVYLCKRIFKKCGNNVNVERKAWFGSGASIELGDYSGIGINAHIPFDTIIGKYVMMGPNCYILDGNHCTSDIETPMCFQGMSPRKQTVIEDDVWIGKDVQMTPGRHIYKGSIIAMGCILCKDFPEYSIVGGNPSQHIKDRRTK